MHVGDILSTVGMISTVGDITINVGEHHEYRGGRSVLWGTQITKGFPHVTEHPHGTHDILHVHHDILHGTEYLPRYSR